MKSKNISAYKNIGFISTRIAGTDGVSLDIAKWAEVLERNGFECFYFSGENDRHPDRCITIDEAHFFCPEIQDITDKCFGHYKRPDEISKKIHLTRRHLKQKIYEFVKKFDKHDNS